MRKALYISLILAFGLLSCESNKKYSDYNETDFYEVQGIVNYVSSPRSVSEKKIVYSYFLDRKAPKIGKEENINFLEAKKGYPLIVLVHKDDENVSFFGQIGILENLNLKEKEYLSAYIQTEMNKIKKKLPTKLYNSIIKDTMN